MKMSSLLKFSPSPSSSSSSTKRKICPICDRTFANGKAMGGHMRAHLAKLPLPTKPQPESAPAREKSPVKTRSNSVTSKPGSSSGYCLTDKEVALCLLKLTNDVWPNGVRPVIRFPLTRGCKRRGELKSSDLVDEAQDKEEDEEEEEEEEDDDASFSVTRTTRSMKKSRGKYKCVACPRVFRSSRSLGGHRASHENKRAKMTSLDTSSSEELEVDRTVGIRRVFECPCCDKVFRSAQALGGHKKVHLSYLETGTTSKPTGRNGPRASKNHAVKNAAFDLNLPAPLEY
ncbi:PREDICTED: zinc finger protein ZAT1 [Tarenaya hassleriana]|uniref:zinc finger protein ZAT1 n=1 Tax=Tarenaya hassleriana TaxID=28532 RepID=UPI00053C9765|nr:PREDICTED: zinc finger protein ZAT1 [Tarenaya hassleriana]